LSTKEISMKDTLKINVDVTNTGDVDGFEIVQLYIRDKVGSITRPVKELKGFQRVFLSKGSKITVEFNLSQADLSFYGKTMKFQAEPGEFTVYAGGNSADCIEDTFRLVE
jgi:beta-glucosidase